MAKLKAQACPTCSAPLEVRPDQNQVTCRYCGSGVQIERGAAPKQTGPVNPHVVYIDPNQGRRMARIIGIVGFAPVLVPVFVFLVPWITKKVSHSVKPLPAHCSVNEEIEISGVTFEGPGPLVVAETNCKISIENSSLKGKTIVSAQGPNVKLTVDGSTVTATDAVVELGGGVNTVRITGKSTVTGDGNVVVAKGNADVTIEDSNLKAGDAVVRGESNVKVSVTRADLQGKSGFAFGPNGDVTLKAATLRVEGTAIVGKSNLKIACDACTVQGADGVRGGSSTSLKISNKGKVVATGTGIEVDGSGDLELDDGRVESRDVAIVAGPSTKIRLAHGAVVKGGRVGIRAESSPTIVLRDSTIESGANAIESRTSARVEAVKSTIKGAALAFAFRSAPSALSLTETTVAGGQNFNVELTPRAPTPPAGATAAAVRAPSAARPLVGPKAAAAGPPPFDGDAAMAALDVAARNASSSCRSSSGKAKRAWVDPGFVPDGTNANAKVRIEKDILAGSPEVACIERVFRSVRIAAFDPKTLPSGMGRVVELKP